LTSTLSTVAPPEDARGLGAVLTPVPVVDYMLQLAGVYEARHWRILEPACGPCTFLSSIAYRCQDAGHEYVGVEINGQEATKASKNHPKLTVLEEDFLLWEPKGRYDLVIGNPPYGIVGDASHYPISVLKDRKSLYKRALTTWHGKYNLYGAFIEKGVRLLAPEGKLVFVVPATFMILDDFAPLRRFLAQAGKVNVHYVGGVFPGRNVVAVVLVLEKGKQGLAVWEWNRLLFEETTYDGGLITLSPPATLPLGKNTVNLGSLFTIYFAARSPEVKRHPLVSKEPGPGLVPILTGRNLHPGRIDYERCYSGLWMPQEAGPSLRPFYAFPHLVIGHTKGGKVVAAVDEKCYPWREDFHLVPKLEGINIYTTAAYLNSEAVQQYVSCLYRDISPHVTTTQLRVLPVPAQMIPPRIGVQARLLV